ncbi:MAG: transketolase [Anaerolineae bacterium]|jgi:transketolase|nr:transketolase [Anaerolineae bacterium]
MTISKTLQEKAINTIRFLSVDGVQTANSGHPGLPMGTAAIAYTLFTRHLKHHPANPKWADRDRFVLSGGHGSMLLYSMLHLTGYDLPLEELKNFRQWGSKTPGHPEYGLTPGVETTTGPLGQGFATGVGMAIAEAHLAGVFNRGGKKIVDHYTFGIVTDGDLMEGISAEAASLAGHLKLGKLIYLYDDNKISIEGNTSVAFTDDTAKRFEAYGWHVIKLADGNDVEAIDAALTAAKADERPSLIICPTIIGYGLPTLAGTEECHGSPPGEEELTAAKEAVGWPVEPKFFIPDDVLPVFRAAVEAGAKAEQNWNETLTDYAAAYPAEAAEFKRRMSGELPEGWDQDLISFPADMTKGVATRNASGKVIQALAARLPELIGGSADLAGSTKTWIEGSPDFQADTPQGRNFHWGVREFAMSAAVNGMNLHGGVIGYGASFVVFSDYCRSAIRTAALSHIPSIFVFTHDSIGLGEDGPTHQPVEHLPSLRAMPNLNVVRPADANETAAMWKLAIKSKHTPTFFFLSRQNLLTFDREECACACNAERGAYVLKDFGENPELILMASGSEVEIIWKAAEKLHGEGHAVRVVSFPCWEAFEAQTQDYKDSVLPPAITKRVVIEAAIPMGWEKYAGAVGKIIGMTGFGASAPYKTLYKEFGISVENVLEKAKELL